MAGNKILNKAKHTHNTDEWYTDYKTVDEEVTQYASQFAGKIVMCNCDDPYESAFTKYFLKHFNILNLKKLICTSYKGSRIVETLDQFEKESNRLSLPYQYYRNWKSYTLEAIRIAMIQSRQNKVTRTIDFDSILKDHHLKSI